MVHLEPTSAQHKYEHRRTPWGHIPSYERQEQFNFIGFVIYGRRKSLLVIAGAYISLSREGFWQRSLSEAYYSLRVTWPAVVESGIQRRKSIRNHLSVSVQG
jgi:hypothetical protein